MGILPHVVTKLNGSARTRMAVCWRAGVDKFASSPCRFPGLTAGFEQLGVLRRLGCSRAFDEGFAIHFQALSRMLTVNAALKAHDIGLGDKPFTPLWQSNVDGTLRIDGVRRNWFIHRQLLPPGDDDVFARRANSSAFDSGALKNGDQMMASEGVAATLFYRTLATPQSLVVNVNTAEADQLSALDRSLTDWAERIVVERDVQGPYVSLSDLTRRVGLSAPLATRLSDMAAAAVTLGTYPRL
jgi:Helix-hairpin-helix motif